MHVEEILEMDSKRGEAEDYNKGVERRVEEVEEEEKEKMRRRTRRIRRRRGRRRRKRRTRRMYYDDRQF